MLDQNEMQIVERALNADLKYGSVGANLSLVCAQIPRTRVDDDSPLTGNEIAVAVRAVQHQLVPNRQWSQAFESLYAKYSGLRLQSNEALLTAAYRESFGGDLLMSPDRLIRLAETQQVAQQLAMNQEWQDQQAAYTQQVQNTAAESRELAQMIIDLTSYLMGSDGSPLGVNEYVRRQTAARIERETNALLAIHADELRARHADWKYKRDLQNMSAAEVRDVVKDQSRLQRYSEFQPIPPEYQMPGKQVSVPWSRQLLQRLPSMEIRRLFKTYGESQLNAAVQNAVMAGRQ